MQQRKIGVVLGSGAAKGWAHIGVLNALVNMGIKIDVIVGCSAGALVGAAYACHRLPVFERWVRSFKYWDVVRQLDLTWHKGGLLHGKRIFDAIEEILHIKEIQECPIRFGTVATNLSTGRELWFTKGNLRQAIRASCSLPGLLSPVYFNGYWLVDGAVVNPLPISLARALGADIIIAVDLQHISSLSDQSDILTLPHNEESAAPPGKWQQRLRERWVSFINGGEKAAPSALRIMRTSIELLESRLKNNRMAHDPPEIVIQPSCSEISLFDFHRADEAILSGKKAVEAQYELLKSLTRLI